jgi:intracellular septation protein
MADRTISPGLKALLEYGPIAVFFGGYLWLKDDVFRIGGTDYGGFVVVTAVFVPLMVLATLIMWRLTGKLSRMQVTVTVMVVVFGGLTIWLNDERFLKMKPTIVFGLFAAILGFGVWRGTSYLEAVLEGAFQLEHEGWMILTRRLAWCFGGLAVANEVIWRFASTDVWVASDTFGQPLVLLAFFLSQADVLKRYMIDKDEA